MRLQFDANGKVIIPKEYQRQDAEEPETRKRKRRSESVESGNKNPVVALKERAKRRRVNSDSSRSSTSSSTVYSKEYIVEKILAHKVSGGRNMFLIKWKGWPEEYNTWEPHSHLEHCTNVLADFFTDVLSQKVLDMLKEKFKLCHNISDQQLESLIPKGGFVKLPSKLQLQRQLLGLVALASKEIQFNNVEKGKQALLMYLLHLKREVQLNNLCNWEEAINKECKEDALIKVENLCDLEGPPKGFVYINECLAMAGITIPDDPLVGCECETCEPRNSTCCGKQNGLFNYRAPNRINVPRGVPIYECNKRCKCSLECRNRVVQSGRKTPLCIYRTNNGCGWGVKALRKIFRGEFVCEYVGEVITHDEAERRGQVYDSIGRTYLFDLDFNSSDNPYTIDAATYGNVSHFINHSCEPNLGVWAVWVNCLDPNLPKLALFALREIEKNEQLTFDYMTSNSSSKPSTPEKLNSSLSKSENTAKRSLCKCNANSCRRYLF